jgi:hypothetical protein
MELSFLKKYRSINGFLERFTLLKIGKLHIRFHLIKTADESTFYHNHPFNYTSIILKGGYRETYLNYKGDQISATHKRFDVIRRKAGVYHRIEEIFGPTTTLFITYGRGHWGILNMEPAKHPDGVFLRKVNGKYVWAKRQQDVWFIGNTDKKIAEHEIRYSINQIVHEG